MWTPREIRKLLILLTGIGLEVAGVVMLVNQIQSEGSIDINSSIISGKIQSGSAGLLICFIGLFVIGLSLIGGKDTIIHSNTGSTLEGKEMTTTTLNVEQKRGLVVILAVGILCLLLIFGGIYFENSGWKGATILSVFGVFFGIIGGILIIAFISSYLDTQPNNKDKSQE